MSSIHTPLCDMFEIEHPIVMAGMSLGMDDAMPSPPKLAAAVTNAGGLGVMGCGSRKPETIDWCIREFKKLSSGPFGIDLLLPVTMGTGAKTETKAEIRGRLERDYPKHVAFVKDLVKEYDLPEIDLDDSEEEAMTQDLLKKEFEVVLDHKVPVFVAGLGDPSWVVPLARAQGMKVGGVVGAVRHAQRQKEADVDFMVAQGTEGGGHTGNIATFPLVPQVVDAAAPLPVLAAGGIGNGRQIAASFVLGAQAVWIGSAFLVAEENEIPLEHQEQIIKGSSPDFSLSKYRTGKQSRSFKSPIKDAWAVSGLDPLPMPLQGILMEPVYKASRSIGIMDLDTATAGQVGGMITERKPAKDIVDRLVAETHEALEKMKPLVN